MQVRIIKSKHANIPTESIGTVEAIYHDPHGYAVAFKGVVQHNGSKRDIVAFFNHDEVEPVPPGEEEEEASPVVIEAVTPVVRFCACSHPLLQTVICQLDPEHKGRHRADVDIHGINQTFLW